MRILFMGTPEIARVSLQALVEAGHEICGAYTREDKPVGRHRVLTAPPVKQYCVEQGIPVFQPRTLRTDEVLADIQALAPQLIVVVAYGRILPAQILNVPALGAVNVHVSLLPQYRGAAPIQWAVINGDEETGVTIMYMDEGLDTGDIIAQEKLAIGQDETSGELFSRVEALGAHLLCDTLAKIEAGTAQRTAQDHASATLAPPLTKEMAKFDFSFPSAKVHNLVRGMNPWPLAFFEAEGKKIKVRKTILSAQSGASGTVLQVNPLVVACGVGSVELVEIIPENGRPMPGASWAAGRRFKVGDVIG